MVKKHPLVRNRRTPRGPPASQLDPHGLRRRPLPHPVGPVPSGTADTTPPPPHPSSDDGGYPLAPQTARVKSRRGEGRTSEEGGAIGTGIRPQPPLSFPAATLRRSPVDQYSWVPSLQEFLKLIRPGSCKTAPWPAEKAPSWSGDSRPYAATPVGRRSLSGDRCLTVGMPEKK
ncbi:hypothetical protein GWI33_003548 [Rhynchophorus ferrugineus]|uniref:Uncharacterized protein n=1 Tax=Rhynchophorus ferrugineus TaxID=354439 RepID=A0A834HKW3_RHYFE|nr:hypothetical protein GWI33_003548 [Rhynchophorus ferrugineus]